MIHKLNQWKITATELLLPNWLQHSASNRIADRRWPELEDSMILVFALTTIGLVFNLCW